MRLLKRALDDEIVQMGLMVAVISGVFLARLLFTGAAPSLPPATAQPPAAAPAAQAAPAPAPAPAANSAPAERAYAGGTSAAGGSRSKVKGRWLVDPAGGADADVATISQAILNAEPGDRIEVKPGVYKENLVFNKELTLVGLPTAEGKIGVTVQASSAEHTITVANGKVAIESLDVEQGLAGAAAVYALSGSLRMANVALRAPRGTGLFVVDSDVTVDHSSFSGSNGLQQWSGSVSCSDCQMANNAEIGVTIGVAMKGATGTPRASFRSLTVKNCAQGGIWIGNHADVKLDGCEVTGSLHDGIAVLNKAKLQAKSCRVHQNVRHGIWAEGESVVDVSDSKFSKNENGVVAAHTALLTVRDSELYENLMGYLYQDESRVTLIGTNVHDNREGAKGRITIGPAPASTEPPVPAK